MSYNSGWQQGSFTVQNHTMKNILVPTDFSPTAHNAALYAVKLAAQMGIAEVVLYHAYQMPVIIDPMAMAPVMQSLDEAQLKKDSFERLEKELLLLKPYCAKDIRIRYTADYALLVNGLDDVCLKENCGWIVMGITGGGAVEETLIGSNTLHVAKNSTFPVIIVPPKAAYKMIHRIALSCDLRSVAEHTPVTPIVKFVQAAQASLYVLNIAYQNTGFDEERDRENQVLQQLLKEVKPRYHFVEHADFMEAVNGFIDEEQIDLLITIPKKHGLLDRLFRKSHTKQIAFHSHVPVMVVHD
jgi:nucleotide-binding universal stress UspA family protein